MKRILRTYILAAVVFALAATTTAAAQEQPKTTSDSSAQPPGGTRVFGVLPNYRTVNETDVSGALTNRQKLTIASKDSFDYPLVLLAGGLAGIGQWSNQNPSFGQGMRGFGKRLATGYADQALGNLMTEGFLPILLHDDPRYYRRGTGSNGSRLKYSFSRIFVTHTDSGGVRFNYSEWIGNAGAVAISNTYYPDGRTFEDNATKLVEQCVIDGLSQVLKEFWPDIKQKFLERHKATGSTH